MSEAELRAETRHLWALSYRLTGVAADADEIVQETFARALEEIRRSGREPNRLWRVRVATNLAMDVLRARKRRAYAGTWLPSPAEIDERDAAAESRAEVRGSVESRYEHVESLSYAFLVALEALGPRARAVLILRDVLDYSAAEVAAILGTSEGNVRILHHRARARMESYDRAVTRRPLRAVAAETRRVLEAFLDCLVRQDAAGVEKLLAEAVRTSTDGGGNYTALRRPLVGRRAVAAFHLKVARWRAPVSRTEIRDVNGLAAAVIETRTSRARQAPRLVLRCDIDSTGKIREIHSILAPRKLTALRFTPL